MISTSPARAAVVEADGLRKNFGETTAVAGISFAVFPGECFGILGPNGAGKTTTVRMVYGFSPPSAGSMKVFGMDIGREGRRIRSRVGVCQQENNLDPELSVRQNLEVFARYFNLPARVAGERASKLLAFMSLDHRGDAKPMELSGGLMRRLMVARALINEPELLILDEPTTGLDPQSRHQVWSRLEELKRRGMTLLLTTRYMDEAARLCDRLMIMDHGKILVEGTPPELIRQHVGLDVIEVSEPSADLLQFVLSAGLPHENLGHRLVIYSRERNSLYHEIGDRYCREGCTLRTATLEDVFLKLTGRALRD